VNKPENPYSAPPLSSPEPKPSLSTGRIVPVDKGLRFANYLIDAIVLYAFGFAQGIGLVVFGGDAGIAFLEGPVGSFIGIPTMIAYYIILEATTGRTLGKFVTGTKVVNENGDRPSFGQVLGRSFARLIPFEAFSFFGTPTRGWHDSLPGTYVVKVNSVYDKYQPDQQPQVDLNYLADHE